MNWLPLARARASIAIPQLVGGGAEKITMKLAERLQQEDLLSQVYTSNLKGAETFKDLHIVALPGSSALRSVIPFSTLASRDVANVFLLTLGFMNFAPILRLRRPKARIVLRVGSILGAEASFRSPLARIRYLTSILIACRAADAIVVQGAFMRDDLVRLIPSIHRKVRIIYNFIEDELWTYHPTVPPIEMPYIFIAAGHRPEKAFDVLIPAFAQSRARFIRKLVVAGVDPADPAFNQLMVQWNLTNGEVIRLGYIPAPYDWIAHADLCVLPSRYEGFSNFLLECGALGKLIVATECPGGNKEFFRSYREIIPVPVGNVPALAEALAAPRSDLNRTVARKRLRQFESSTVYAEYVHALFD